MEWDGGVYTLPPHLHRATTPSPVRHQLATSQPLMQRGAYSIKTTEWTGLTGAAMADWPDEKW